MAVANFVSGYGSSNDPFVGHLNLDQGRFVCWGRATFTTTATTCTIPPRGNGSVRADAVYLTAGTSGVVNLSYAVGADGTITVTRTDTTSGGEFSFLIVYG